MNNIDKAVEEEIRKCELNDTVPSILSDTTETEEEQNTSKSEDSLSEEQEKYWKEFTEKMKKELHIAASDDVEQEMKKSLLVNEARKFYAEQQEPERYEYCFLNGTPTDVSNQPITTAQQTEDTDNVNHPQHYTGSIECIDAMLQQFGKEQVKSFCLLNAFKYLFRCNKKHNTPIEDVKKAIWYLNKYIEIVNNI